MLQAAGEVASTVAGKGAGKGASGGGRRRQRQVEFREEVAHVAMRIRDLRKSANKRGPDKPTAEEIAREQAKRDKKARKMARQRARAKALLKSGSDALASTQATLKAVNQRMGAIDQEMEAIVGGGARAAAVLGGGGAGGGGEAGDDDVMVIDPRAVEYGAMVDEDEEYARDETAAGTRPDSMLPLHLGPDGKPDPWLAKNGKEAVVTGRAWKYSWVKSQILSALIFFGFIE